MLVYCYISLRIQTFLLKSIIINILPTWNSGKSSKKLKCVWGMIHNWLARERNKQIYYKIFFGERKGNFSHCHPSTLGPCRLFTDNIIYSHSLWLKRTCSRALVHCFLMITSFTYLRLKVNMKKIHI